MGGEVEGKVALITGAARGQGRSHAVLLAEEGADIIAVDACKPIESVAYRMASLDDLQETVRMVKDRGRRVIAAQADVRDYAALKTAVDDGVAQLGRLDIVCANAGISSAGLTHEMPLETWRDVIDINLSGVFHTAKAAIPHSIEGGRGGSMVITNSALGLKGMPNIVHYTSAKHGLRSVRDFARKEWPPSGAVRLMS